MLLYSIFYEYVSPAMVNQWCCDGVISNFDTTSIKCHCNHLWKRKNVHSDNQIYDLTITKKNKYSFCVKFSYLIHTTEYTLRIYN